MFIDHEGKWLCTPLGVRCLAAALVIHRHRTPNGVREPLFVLRAINIALLTECGASTTPSWALKLARTILMVSSVAIRRVLFE